MREKTLTILGFDKILERLANMAVCGVAKLEIAALEPKSDFSEIALLLDETNDAVSIILRAGNPPISPLSDIRAAIARAVVGASLSARELLNIAHALRCARLLLGYLNEKDFDYVRLKHYAEGLTPMRPTEQRIFDVIINDDEIADDASAELASIRRRSRSLSGRIKEILDEAVRHKYHKYLQEPIVTIRSDRYVIPVKAEHRADVPGIVHDASASGATLFVEPMSVVETNNELRRLAVAERQEVERILMELSQLVAQDSADIKDNFGGIINLDIIFARAKLALEQKATRPVMNKQGVIDLKKARHPLLDPKTAVPTDIILGGEYDSLIITGPNTGGKTVALKTIGLLTLMAQAGLFIPARDQSEMAVFEQVFADIGDEQSIEQSLSTFSSHMVNIVHIMERADHNSLILFDELGAGTDPAEGAALAIAILEYARAMGAKTAATTHYSELKLYALTTERVENAACEFDVETLRPTYRLLIGIPGKSNAFAIARRLGLSQHIIDRAKEQLTAENVRFEDVISGLEQNRSAAREELAQAQSYKMESERLKIEAEAERTRLQSQRGRLVDEARREARALLTEARRESEKIIADIQRAAKEQDEKDRQQTFAAAKSQFKTKLDKLDNELAGTRTKPPKGKAVKKEELKLGSTVQILSLGQKGNVLTLPDNKGNLQVQAGILKVSTNISDLALVPNSSAADAVKSYNMRSSVKKTADIGTSIDVRGQLPEEAIMNVDKFIDDALMASLESITIIHGKGTGVLRKGIGDFLKRRNGVKSHRMGRYGEGEAGVTVVELENPF